MKTERLNQWLTLGANLAVFASILFLAVEIRQNQLSLDEANQLSRLDARALEVEQFNGFRSALIDNPQLLVTWNEGLADKELSAEQETIFGLLCTNIVWISAGSWERSNALGRADAAAATSNIRKETIQDSKRFAKCWQQVRNHLISYGLAGYVNEVEDGLTVQNVEQ
jgi:hypothetical protein